MENMNIPESTTPEAKANDIGGIDRLATLLSWVLVPLMMPLYGILMLFSLSQLAAATIGVKAIVSLVIIGINVVLPMMRGCGSRQCHRQLLVEDKRPRRRDSRGRGPDGKNPHGMDAF